MKYNYADPAGRWPWWASIIKLFGCSMIKTRKYLRFEQMKMELNAVHPKEVSRAVMCFRDEDSNTFKTAKYGEVTDTTIEWNDAVEILYTNQEMFQLETHCEHEYGYEIDELQALYKGQVYIKTENFFRPLTLHIFNASTGEKCGILKYIIKVIEREVIQTAKVKQEVREQATVQVDLIAKISLYAASLTFNTPLFKKEKYYNDFCLTISICGSKVEGVYKKNFQWAFQSVKIDYMDNSPEEVSIHLKQDDQTILIGKTTMTVLKNNKRFVTHSIPLHDSADAKIATLALDLRYITKQEVLDLLYSPTKLSGPVAKDPREKDKSPDLFQSKVSQGERMRANSSLLSTTKKQKELSRVQASHYNLPSKEGRVSNRYHKVILNNSNEIIIPRAKRFSEVKANPNHSYSDPEKLSDFYSPRRNGPLRGYDMGLSRKTDFTKQYRNNPGVGSYKLPSIWDKY